MDATVAQAIQEYKSNRLDRALSLLMKDLKEHPDDGTAHYYLGCVFKKAGADASAIHELETAIKLCPPGVTQALAKEALHGGFKEEAPVPPAVAGAAPAANWFTPVLNFFHPTPPPKPGSTPLPPAELGGWQMPDFFSPMKHSVKNAKTWIRLKIPPNAFEPKAPVKVAPAPVYDDSSDVIPMGEMQALVEDSRHREQKWQSHSTGVMRFPQAPENSGDWDRWITRYRRTFNNQLFRHLAKEARSETAGTAGIIFSVDKDGHLRGCIYESTADPILANCLLETIRDMDKSYVLAFPPNSRVSGWNFRTQWNFKKALMVVRLIRQHKAQAIAAVTKVQASLLKTDAKLKPKVPPVAEKALANKLAMQSTSAKISPPPLVVKTGVSGLVLPKPKPVELKATTLKLSDMPPLPPSDISSTTLEDKDIDDLNIMNSDISGLFK